MKIRKGFVSNSSSSSFTCDVCGNTESGMDTCLSDWNMSRCENGHEICDKHKIDVKSGLTSQEKKQKWLEAEKDSLKFWENHDSDYAPTYAQEAREVVSKIEQLEGDELEDSFEYGDGFDWYEDYLNDAGFPEQECPICQFESLMDSTLAEYVLKTQNKTRADFLAVFKSQFPNYQALETFLKEG